MALLEVVLLAGPAFAVGAKRSRRQLALLAATGAGRKDIRRTVLGGGLVLGAVGGVIGLVGGLGLARAALPVIARFNDDVPGPFEIVPWQLAGIALVGVGTALLAALLPARAAARQDVVAALTGRAGAVVASRRLVPLLGLVALALGALLTPEGAGSCSGLLNLAGSVIAELGLVAMTPTLVGAAGRLGPLLPVAGRLALRDASRNRSRTAPAVSAILAAVAGTVAVGTFLVSQDRMQQDAYRGNLAVGSAVVNLYDDAVEQLPQVVEVLRRELPAAQVVTARVIDAGGEVGAVDVVPARDCPSGGCGGRSYINGTLVGDADLVAAVTGSRDPALARALARGGAVVPAVYLQDDGTVLLVNHPPGDVDRTKGVQVRVPAAALPEDAYQAVVLSPQAAALMGRPVIDVGAVAATTRIPTEREQARASEAVQQLAQTSSVYVERGYSSSAGVTVLALAGISALLVLGASGIATGLAAADGRADLSTLACVGATPGLRRRLAGSQSLVTAGLGTALGTVAGLIPAYGLIRALNEPDSTGYVRAVPFPFVVPWTLLGVTALVVPLLAALAALLLTRSRLPLVRRIA
ncbi:MAG: FtsX-like permease family protein [Frankiales bacterium]|nr:FtsX-like permease family protein [Frankiales bacterium]